MDLSLYKEESQLKQRRGKKRKASPLKTTKRAKSTTKKSPDVAKVRKIAPAKVVKKKTGKVSKSKVVVKKQQVVSEVKKAAVTQQGRAERAAKRRGPDGVVAVATKSPPVVDQKKAKVLAKVARKGVQKNQAAAKSEYWVE